ncbi:MAG: hypothetical protein PUP90_15140 [Nostoc sp. S4]|nr:hypothetical protein [Nostoc sp. S4]
MILKIWALSTHYFWIRQRFDIACDWVSKHQAQQILGIKQAQLRNDTALLVELKTPGFDYIPYSDKGYNRSSMQVLVEFDKLVEKKGRATIAPPTAA